MSLKCSAIKLSDTITKGKPLRKNINDLKSAKNKYTTKKFEYVGVLSASTFAGTFINENTTNRHSYLL